MPAGGNRCSRQYQPATASAIRASEVAARMTDRPRTRGLPARLPVSIALTTASADAMRRAKAAQFEQLRSEYRHLRDSQWGGDKRYDAWINQPMNNARLLPFGLYDQWVPAFAALFREVGGDWAVFYQRVEAWGRLPFEQRQQALESFAGKAGSYNASHPL